MLRASEENITPANPLRTSSMIYGITGNPTKNTLWTPVADLVDWLGERELPFRLHASIAAGLVDRGLIEASVGQRMQTDDLAAETDLLLSFGGDGTMLRTAHEVGINDTPILGVNIGRLGFLADIEVESLTDAIEQIEQGEYRVESRMVLEGTLDNHADLDRHWALNEFVLDRSGASGLLEMEVTVDGRPLNTYWADGLIIATPTGSTAYSLSTGGPIITPGCDAIILTPMAPHTLTVRPIVLPSHVDVEIHVYGGDHPHLLAADGRSMVFENAGHTLRIRRAEHTVNLVKLPDQHYFKTLRNKLMWGAHRRHADRNLRRTSSE